VQNSNWKSLPRFSNADESSCLRVNLIDYESKEDSIDCRFIFLGTEDVT
jgi:hypothetical protein